MARKKQQDPHSTTNRPILPTTTAVSSKRPNPVIPTEDHRHITSVRLGKISSEIFCHDPKRRAELGLNPLPMVDSDFIGELRK